MSNASYTLLYSIKNEAFDINGRRIAFLNAESNDELYILNNSDLVLQQYYKPYVDKLAGAEFSASPDIPNDNKSYDLVCVLLPKNMIEARYLIARGAGLLKVGGSLICAADNKAGGSRLAKLMSGFGFSDLQIEARNKARCVWGSARDLNNNEINSAIIAGEECDVLDGEFRSRAGVFSWNKIDKGSQILSSYIPAELKGKGADFGCGYGYLSRLVLSKCRKIKMLYCADADYRAVSLCRDNIKQYECRQEFLWCDLTKSQDSLRNLDFVVMNPPFHEGKKMDVSIGKDFIDTAYKSLRRGGRLFMVANNHLDYERILQAQFFECHNSYEGQGFKVFVALK